MLDERYKQSLIDDLCKLVRIPSRSFPSGGEEGELQRWVAERMRRTGARVRTVEADNLPSFRVHPLCCGPERNYRDRPTVIAEMGPEGAPALLIAAHSDTVPISKFEEWTFSPFLGEVRDGKVCGLGSSDDKWGTASMLTIMRAVAESGRPLRKRLIFASTIDEENGVGNGLLLLMLAGVKAEAALYLDGYLMEILIGNSGGSNLYLRPKAPLMRELFQRHATLLETACQELSRRREALFARPFYENSCVRRTSALLSTREDSSGPFFLLAFYTVKGEEKGAVCRQFEDAVRKALGADLTLYETSYRTPWFEPALLEEKAPVVQLMARSLRAVRGVEPRIAVVSKQDVFVLHNHAKIPTISFGVGQLEGRGTHHQPDEAVSAEDVWTGCRIVHHAVTSWLEEQP